MSRVHKLLRQLPPLQVALYVPSLADFLTEAAHSPRLPKLLITLDITVAGSLLTFHCSSPSPPAEFTPFPKLPLELRLRVWKYAALQPRDVILHLPLRRSPSVSYGIQGRNHTPPLLRVWKESRAEALRYYAKCRENSENAGGIRFSKTIFVNYDIDRFVQVCNCVLPLNNPEEYRPTSECRHGHFFISVSGPELPLL